MDSFIDEKIMNPDITNAQKDASQFLKNHESQLH